MTNVGGARPGSSQAPQPLEGSVGHQVAGERQGDRCEADGTEHNGTAAVILGFLATTTEVGLRGRWVKNMSHELCCFLHPDAERKDSTMNHVVVVALTASQCLGHKVLKFYLLVMLLRAV
jgi:hypothetical protein